MPKQTTGYSERPHTDLDGGVSQLSSILKRDLYVAIGVFVVSIILDSVSSKEFVSFLPAATICGAMIWFWVRVSRFPKSHRFSKCPDCNSELEIENRNDVCDPVCHQCRIRFIRYRPSSDPNRILK